MFFFFRYVFFFRGEKFTSGANVVCLFGVGWGGAEEDCWFWMVLVGSFKTVSKVLVVSTQSKNISQNGSFPQIGVKIKMFETTT